MRIVGTTVCQDTQVRAIRFYSAEIEVILHPAYKQNPLPTRREDRQIIVEGSVREHSGGVGRKVQ